MTEPTTKTNEEEMSGKNSRVVVMCVSMVLAMGGLAYAAVPLYDLFCRVTGYGGTTQTAENTYGIEIVDRDITVRFDANISRELAWDFRAAERDVTLKLGEQRQIAYLASNPTDEPLTGSATFNVTPQSAGAYFNKIQCFCFTETTLHPGETMEMPVVFFVDPELLDHVETQNIQTITLSYTFFPKEPTLKPVASLEQKDADNDGNELLDQGRLR